MKEIQQALEYALMILEDQANEGLYPKKALVEFGGSGYEPILKALKLLKSKRHTEPASAIAEDFAFDKFKSVSNMLGEDYKTGYKEGIQHYIENARKNEDCF